MPATTLAPRYPRFAAYCAAARPKSEWWRIILGCAGIFALQQALLVAVVGLLRQRYGSGFADALLLAITYGMTPGSLVLLLSSFAIVGSATLLAVRIVHDRPPATLFGPSVAAAFRTFLWVAPALIALDLVLVPVYLATTALQPHLQVTSFLTWLPLALPALLIQVSAEELIFRGYLQQQLGVLSRNALVWMVLPSLVFAGLHHDPMTYGTNAWLSTLWTFAFAILAADLTARSGNLGAAIAFHFAINFSGFFLNGIAGNADGLALWTMSVDLSDPAVFRPMVLGDFLALLNTWLLARLALRT